MNLPYNQFTNINFLSSTERLYKNKNYIPYKFKNQLKFGIIILNQINILNIFIIRFTFL